jgi:hypothetical protein
MVFTVTPIRTVIDGEDALELAAVTITSQISQQIEIYVDGQLAASEPVTANTPKRIGFTLMPSPPVSPGIKNLRIVGLTAGEWRGVGALARTQFFIDFVDENGNPILVDSLYMNLDTPFLINQKRARRTSARKYIDVPGRWILEVSRQEPDGTFRFAIIDLDTITGDTTITLPKLKEAFIRVSIDLGVAGSAIITSASAIDWFLGQVASVLGLTNFPSLAAYIINHVFNTMPYPPHAWHLEGNILHIDYKVTPDAFAIAPLTAAVLIFFILAGTISFAIHRITTIKVAEVEKARAEAQAKIAKEHTDAINRWLEHAQTAGLTAQETVRGLEAITAAYKQMTQNLQPFPQPFPWGTIALIGALALIGSVAIAAIFRGVLR